MNAVVYFKIMKASSQFLNNRMKSPVLPFTSNFFSDLAEQFDYSVGTGRVLNT